MLDKRVKEALNKVDFVNRYLALCDRYSRDAGQCAEFGAYDISDEGLDEHIGDFTTILVYNDEEFCCVIEPIDVKRWFHEYEFGFAFGVWGSEIEVVWSVKQDGEYLLCMDDLPVSGFAQVLTHTNVHAMPMYSSYEDIRGIIAGLLDIYTDFQKALMNDWIFRRFR